MAKSPLLLIVHDQPALEIPQQYRRSIERPRLVIGLQDAIAKVVEVRFGLAANAPWPPAILRGELEALPVGGYRTELWCSGRNWVHDTLRADRFRLLLSPLGGGFEAEEVHPDYWRATEHDAVMVQRLILHRNRTGSWQFDLGSGAFGAALKEIRSDAPAPSLETAEADEAQSVARPKPIRPGTASYDNVRAVVKKHGRATEGELLEAAKAALPNNSVPREWVRLAIEELYGKPGRTGRPKSAK